MPSWAICQSIALGTSRLVESSVFDTQPNDPIALPSERLERAPDASINTIELPAPSSSRLRSRIAHGCFPLHADGACTW